MGRGQMNSLPGTWATRAVTSGDSSGRSTGGQQSVRSRAVSEKHRAFFAAARQQLRVRKTRRGLVKCSGEPVDRYQGSLDSVLHRELLSTNLPALLHYEDRNSMAFSLESRVPYLDVRLVEYIASLPLAQKLRKGSTKVSLRAAIRGLVPESVRCRGDKMGFVTPEECWMKDNLRPFMLEIFLSGSFQSRPYWDASAVARDYQAFLARNVHVFPRDLADCLHRALAEDVF